MITVVTQKFQTFRVYFNGFLTISVPFKAQAAPALGFIAKPNFLQNTRQCINQ